MRRTLLLVVVAVIAAMALPAIGQVITSHGGSPSDVFMTTDRQECSGEDPIGRGAASLLPTPITVGGQSHVVATFTATVTNDNEPRPETVMRLRIEGTDFEASSPQFIERGANGHSTVAVMWTFDSIAAGDYSVLARARLPGRRPSEPGAVFQACALTVFVTPVVA
jgi:hypothetical protein